MRKHARGEPVLVPAQAPIVSRHPYYECPGAGCAGCDFSAERAENLPTSEAVDTVPAGVTTMRLLTTDELKSETLHRIMLRINRRPSRGERDLVDLIAEMIELSREQVPECYVQTTIEPTPQTAPGRGWTTEPNYCTCLNDTTVQMGCPLHDRR